MGHIRIGRMPMTQRWKDVLRLLAERASESDIADACLKAAEASIKRIPNDGGFLDALTTIFEFADAIRSPNMLAELRLKGFRLTNNPSLFDLSSALKDRIDEVTHLSSSKSYVGEITQNSFSESLYSFVSRELPTLFGNTPENEREVVRRQFTGNRFRNMMHEFYSNLTRRYLMYHLGRELPKHIGADRRFANLDGHSEFGKAFNVYVRQSVRITEEFTPGWFSKARWEDSISQDSVSRYAHFAFKKILMEFGKRSRPDA
ncbi:MAG: hypothetical protein KAT85_07725 [candidate division Zixibacteria bacterium]|nr:hypothetical protein [candidate division Zixibacteria bacterium]